jgi:hypothetical protein
MSVIQKTLTKKDFDKHLNETFPKTINVGERYTPSLAMKKLDKRRYEQRYDYWVSMMRKNGEWLCGNCKKEFTKKIDAVGCCTLEPIEIYFIGGSIHKMHEKIDRYGIERFLPDFMSYLINEYGYSQKTTDIYVSVVLTLITKD